MRIKKRIYTLHGDTRLLHNTPRKSEATNKRSNASGGVPCDLVKLQERTSHGQPNLRALEQAMRGTKFLRVKCATMSVRWM